MLRLDLESRRAQTSLDPSTTEDPEVESEPAAAAPVTGPDTINRPMKDLLTVGEVAVLLGRTKKAVYALVARGNLPGAIKVGRSVMVRRADLLSSTAEGRVPSRRKRR